MVALALNPAVADPRKSLKANERALLRKLDTFGPAVKVNGGWMLGGDFHRQATLAFLKRHELGTEMFKDGKHRLAISYGGRAALAMLAP